MSASLGVVVRIKCSSVADSGFEPRQLKREAKFVVMTKTQLRRKKGERRVAQKILSNRCISV